MVRRIHVSIRHLTSLRDEGRAITTRKPFPLTGDSPSGPVTLAPLHVVHELSHQFCGRPLQSAGQAIGAAGGGFQPQGHTAQYRVSTKGSSASAAVSSTPTVQFRQQGMNRRGSRLHDSCLASRPADPDHRVGRLRPQPHSTNVPRRCTSCRWEAVDPDISPLRKMPLCKRRRIGYSFYTSINYLAHWDELGRAMPAKLVSLSDGPSILLDKPIVLLGRHAECDVQINSRKISRRHCCIARVQDYLVVRDLGSTNGLRINGVRVVEGRLRTGDELTIGNHRYQVSITDSLSDASTRAGSQPIQSSTSTGKKSAILESRDEPVALEPRSSSSSSSSRVLPDQINLRNDSKP